jgi:hypothetical protein
MRDRTYNDELRVFGIPASSDDPKLLWINDAEIIGYSRSERVESSRRFHSQKVEDRVGVFPERFLTFVAADTISQRSVWNIT